MKRIETGLLLQTIAVLAWCALTVGIKAAWVPWITLGLVLPGIGMLAAVRVTPESGQDSANPFPQEMLRKVDSTSFFAPHSGWPFLPLGLYVAYLAVVLLNPSHAPGADGGWAPLDSWIPWLPTAVDRGLALHAAAPWLAALAQAAVVAVGLRSRAALRWLAIGISAIVLALSLAGSLFHFTGATLALGILPVPADYFFASFLYKNHWTAFALLGAASTAGLAFSAWDRSKDNRRMHSERLGWFAVLLLILMTLPLPGSRSGVLFGSILLICVFGAAAVRILRRQGDTPRHGRLVLISTLAGSLVLAAGWLGRDALQRAYQKTHTQMLEGGERGPAYLRLKTAADTCRMAAARPLFGWGPGSFQAVFPLFQGDYCRDGEGRINSYFNAAHCDWAQIAAEYGLVPSAAMLALVCLGAIRIRRVPSRWSRWVLVGLSLLGIYAIGEFPLQNRAVLLLAAVLTAGAGRWSQDLRYR